jgi:hypothetical protein
MHPLPYIMEPESVLARLQRWTASDLQTRLTSVSQLELGGSLLLLGRPVQATLRRNIAPDPRLDPEQARDRAGALELAVGSQAVFLGRSYFGCLATVLPDASRGLSKKVQRKVSRCIVGLNVQWEIWI